MEEGHETPRMTHDDLVEEFLGLEAQTSNDPLPETPRRSEEVVPNDDNDSTKEKVQASTDDHPIEPETDDADIEELIETRFNNENNNERVKKLGLGGCCNAIKAYSISTAALARRMALEFDEMEKEKEGYLKQIAELQNKLFETERKLAKMENEEISVLKEEFNLEKCDWITREEELKEENWKLIWKIDMLEFTHRVDAKKLKEEIEVLKAGFDKAVNKVLGSISS